MSYIRQTVYVNSYSDLPSVGATGVMYIVRTKPSAAPLGIPPVPGEQPAYIVKGWFWNGSEYKEIVDTQLIVHAPYSNTSFQQLNTIKKALDYLLSQDLQVVFNVIPSEVSQSGTYSVTFTWNLNKKVDEIEAIYIEDITNSPVVLESNLTQKTTVTFGSTTISMLINSSREFRITVEDVDGNIATATQTISYDLNRVLVDTFMVEPTMWEQDPINNVVELAFDWALSMDKEHASSLVLSERNLAGSGNWTEIDTDLLDSTASNGVGSKTISRTITVSKEYRLRVTSVSGASPDSREAAVTYIPYINISMSDLVIVPDTSTGEQNSYTFASTTNKTPTSIKLYQLTGYGGSVVPGDSPNSVLNTPEGLDYVTITPSGTTINHVLSLTIVNNVYFRLQVEDVDAKGNTSSDTSESMVTYESTLAFTGALSMIPETYYYGRAFSADLNILFNEVLDSTTYNDITALTLRFSVLGGVGTLINVPMTKSSFISVGSNELNGTLPIGSSVLGFYGQRNANIIVSRNVGSGFASDAKLFNMQREIEINSLVVEKMTDDSMRVTVVFNKLFHTGAITDLDNTYVFRESDDGSTFDVVDSGDIIFSSFTSSGQTYTKAVFTTEAISGLEDADYYFRVEENLGAKGSNATSADTETYSYVLPVAAGDVYFGALTDTVLNEFGYSRYIEYELHKNQHWSVINDTPYFIVMDLLYGDWSTHLSAGDIIYRFDIGGQLVNGVVDTVSYIAIENKTQLFIHKPSDWDATSETFSRIVFEAHVDYKRVTELTLDTGGTDSVFDILFQDGFFDVSPLNINEKVKVLNPTTATDGFYITDGDTDHVKAKFQDNFINTDGHAWVAFPDGDFPNYTHERDPFGGETLLVGANIFVKDITIGGLTYKLYLWAGNSTPGGNIVRNNTIANTELKYIGS